MSGDRQVTVRGWGDFGDALCAHLSADFDAAHGEPPSTDPWDGTLIAALGEHAWPTAAALDDVGHAHGRPWLPVLSTPTELRCGPVVRPGETPCWHCAAGAGAAGLEQSGDAPTGFMALHLDLAAEAVRALLAGGPTRTLSVDLLSTTLNAAAIDVGYHGCPRCRGAAAALDLEGLVA